LVSPTDETVPLEAERPIAPPRFDEKSIQRARPAVPLNLRGRLGSWSAAAVVLCVLGGVAGGALGGLAINYFQHGPRAAESAQARQEPSGPPVTADATTSQANTSTTATNAPNATTGTPTADTGTAAPSSTQAGAPPAVQPASADAGAQGERAAAAAEHAGASRDSAGSDGVDEVEADAGVQGELRAALGEWVAATNARDVGRQMNFYAPTVDAFYLSRNASRDAVRAEKSRVFSAARDVNVQAAPPEIRLSRDGRTAVMRFRKRYQITGGAGERSGEVLQELRWRRTPKGWKIVSERDLRVLQ